MARDRYKKIKPVGDRQRNDSWDLIILDATFLNKKSPSSAEKETNNSNQKKYYKCEKCNSKFINEESLEKHRSTMLCPMCCPLCKCHAITQLDNDDLFCNSCKTTFSNNLNF